MNRKPTNKPANETGKEPTAVRDREMRALEIFEGALGVPAAERGAYLEKALSEAPELRARVESLLAPHAKANEVLGSDALVPAMSETTDGAAPHLSSPASDSLPRADTIRGYRILKEIHRGGQGVVYQAVQESARRKVAVKVLLEGPFAGKDTRRRFEREIALVGSLRHPGIVPVSSRRSATPSTTPTRRASSTAT